MAPPLPTSTPLPGRQPLFLKTMGNVRSVSGTRGATEVSRSRGACQKNRSPSACRHCAPGMDWARPPCLALSPRGIGNLEDSLPHPHFHVMDWHLKTMGGVDEIRISKWADVFCKIGYMLCKQIIQFILNKKRRVLHYPALYRRRAYASSMSERINNDSFCLLGAAVLLY